ncbi:MAG: nickel-dependent hydrogenase large subunit [Arcobacteraceae bacterium]|nr:nickel-dependent hydrogenase large subunit [Arcobacteraceae bacterium]
MIELIEKIEGEAKLNFSFKNKKIDFVDIEFLSSRHIENILKGKNPLDALVINPRVCGICNHAHLIATVQALENCYEDIEISQKAKIARELTLNFEIIQNHFKWIYLTLFPLLGFKQNIKGATYPSQLMAKAIATIAGQYPHNSYAVVGGIVSEITTNDLIKMENYIDEVIKFYQETIINANIEDFLVCDSVEKILNANGDLPLILNTLKNKKISKIGKSFDRFIAFGDNSYFKSGRGVKTKINHNINVKYVNEHLNKNSYAKNVKFKNYYYEVGALSRAMINKTPLIKESHRKYQDSIFSRVLARICEIPQLLIHSKQLISEINLQEPSYIKPKIDISKLNTTGIGIVEAARGSLIHKVNIKENKIIEYQIITPTQWNLSNGNKNDLGVSQKAMVGLEDTKLAQIVFKSFDVCSVCTTH